MIRRLLAPSAAAVALSACASTAQHAAPAPPLASTQPAPTPAPQQPPVTVVTRTVEVPVPVPTPVRCVPRTLGPPPAYPDTDAALRDAAGAADRYQLIAAGRLMRVERLAQLEDVVRRCRDAAAGR